LIAFLLRKAALGPLFLWKMLKLRPYFKKGQNMLQVAVNQAKNQLSALIHAAEEGEEVVLTRHGKPVVRLVAETSGAAKTSREALAQEALEQLRAFRAMVGPDPDYDWKKYRDEGRE
jgi:prevent-host-death family protein